MNVLIYIIPLYHFKTTEVKDTDEQGYISFSKTKMNYKSEVQYFIKYTEYCSIILSASSRKLTSKVKTGFSGFCPNHIIFKNQRKEEEDFIKYHIKYTLCSLAKYFLLSSSFSVKVKRNI